MLITATKTPRKCKRYNTCGGDIYTGFRYFPLRRGKVLCESCYNKTKPDEDDLFWEWLINKVGE